MRVSEIVNCANKAVEATVEHFKLPANYFAGVTFSVFPTDRPQKGYFKTYAEYSQIDDEHYVVSIYAKSFKKQSESFWYIVHELVRIFEKTVNKRIYKHYRDYCICDLLEDERYSGLKLWSDFFAEYGTYLVVKDLALKYKFDLDDIMMYPVHFVNQLRHYVPSTEYLSVFTMNCIRYTDETGKEYTDSKLMYALPRLNRKVAKYLCATVELLIEYSKGEVCGKRSSRELRRLGHYYEELFYWTDEYKEEERPFDKYDIEDYDAGVFT